MYTDAIVLRNSGQFEAAKKKYEEILRAWPKEARAIAGLGGCLIRLGQRERGLEEVRRAVKMGPHGAKTYAMVANCYEKLHRIEEALEANRLAQIANPQNKYLELQEAKLIARNGDYQRAKDILRETTRAPGLQPELRRQIFGELGRVLDKLKRYDQAYEAFVQSGLEASRTPKAQRFKLEHRPGFINLIFPEAKIIVALRDPRDCCLSSFMQDFELSSAMLHLLALDRTVRFYTQVMGAWLHFRDIVSLSHITVRYEDIVQNLEFEAKRLIDYLDLDWEPDVLQFHQRAMGRVISTPSYVAVTEPCSWGGEENPRFGVVLSLLTQVIVPPA